MPDELTLAKLTFTYEEGSCGCAHVYLSDGVNEAWLWGSHIFSPPLVELTCAFAEILRSSDTATCRWWTEPGEERWVLRREGNLLNITILSFRDFFRRQPNDAGDVIFATTCDLAHFARKLWLAISRRHTSLDDSTHKPTHQRLALPADRLPNSEDVLHSFIEAQKRQSSSKTRHNA
jgi:hypothetical protein